MDVIWIEGQCFGTRWTLVALADIRFLIGITYFVFMFSRYFFRFKNVSVEQIAHSRWCSERRTDNERLGEPRSTVKNRGVSLRGSRTHTKHPELKFGLLR